MRMSRKRGRRLATTALMIAALAICGIGCGGEKSTSPSPGPPPPLVSGTIDAGGGQLACGNVVLTVPAGALDAATALAIYAEQDGHPFGVAGAPLYRLTGLPGELGKPVELRIRHGFDLGTGDTLTFFLGQEREGFDRQRGLSWEAAAARDSAGWCVAALERGALLHGGASAGGLPAAPVGDSPAASRGNLLSASDGDLLAAAAEDVRILRQTAGHFRIIFRTSEVAEQDAAQVLVDFESAYQGTLLMGFQYEQPERVFPLDIYARVPVKPSPACYVSGPYGKGYFELDPEEIDPEENLMPVAMHEVLHSAQTFYDPRPPEQWETLNQERLWLDEATAAYVETLAEGSLDYFPIGMDADSYLAPLYGLAGDPELGPDKYGYGMASFIRYLVEERFAGQGTDRILELYQRFKTGGDVTAAIDAVVSPPVATWCADLHRQLVEGRIYHLDPQGVIWEAWSDRVNLGCGLGATAHGRLTVPDLGAGILKLDLLVDEPDTLLALVVRARAATDGRPGTREHESLPLTVYGCVSGGLPVRLAAGTDSLTLGDWLQVLEIYQSLLVMVSGPYSTAPGHTGTREVEVDARVVLDGGAIDVASFDAVVIEVRTDNMYEWGGPIIDELIGITSDVSWQGNGFFAVSAEDTFAIHLNPATLELGDWYGRTRYRSIGGNVILRRLGGHTLELDDWDANGVIYRVQGLEACGVLTHVFQSYAVDFQEAPYHWLTGYSCRSSEALYSGSKAYVHLFRRP
jgi:hypothetical protein